MFENCVELWKMCVENALKKAQKGQQAPANLQGCLLHLPTTSPELSLVKGMFGADAFGRLLFPS